MSLHSAILHPFSTLVPVTQHSSVDRTQLFSIHVNQNTSKSDCGCSRRVTFQPQDKASHCCSSLTTHSKSPDIRHQKDSFFQSKIIVIPQNLNKQQLTSLTSKFCKKMSIKSLSLDRNKGQAPSGRF